MINHSPAQLIAELRRLMDMDYERLPGARHVLEEAIAVIRPLAEKSDVGEMIDPLRALVAQWERAASLTESVSRMVDTEEEKVIMLRADMKAVRWCAAQLTAELDALLSAPVVIGGDGPPIASCLLCGLKGPLAVWYGGTRAGVCDTCRAKVSAPVGSPPPQGWQPIATAPKDCELLLYGEYTSGARGLVQGAWNHGGAMHMPHWMGGILRPTHWMPLPSAPVVMPEAK